MRLVLCPAGHLYPSCGFGIGTEQGFGAVPCDLSEVCC